MKKTLSLILVLTLCLTAFAFASAEGSGMKLGLQIDTTIAKSKDASDTDGMAQVDSVAAAVLVDAEGKLADVAIDAIQSQLPFTATGTLGAEFPTEFMTKAEIGADYGMAAVSPIGKEWFEQIAALEAYLIGKTVDEIKGLEMTESGTAVDPDLMAGCTIHIGEFTAPVIAAMEKAVDCAANAGDKVGLGITSSASKSKDAMDGKDGQCQAYSFFSAVTTDASGKITACLLDSTQGTVKFDATGKITNDLTARTLTKQELKDDYGMRAASGIGKEWFEQADAMAAYVVGKTVEQVEGIALDETGHATEADLTASVTVSASPLIAAILKAAK